MSTSFATPGGGSRPAGGGAFSLVLPEPRLLEVPRTGDLTPLIESVPRTPAVFLIWPRQGAPYLGRTALLRRRLKRLLRPRSGGSRMLNLREIAARVEYWRIGSRLEAALYSWSLGRRYFPDDYQRRLRIRMPVYVKLIRAHRFPRTRVTTRLSGGNATFVGPFRTRTAAEKFEDELLDLFQIRRCQEDLEPSTNHPGCLYGEMGRCLRPCQEVVGEEEYGAEVHRVAEFLATGGETMLRSAAAARERCSKDLNFEEAARQHQRYQRIQQVLKLREDLARDVSQLNGIAVTPSAAPETIDLWFVLGGCWLSPRRFKLNVTAARPVSLDQRVREIASSLEQPKLTLPVRREHLALLARWYYSSWRDGEWLPFEDPRTLPCRKLVNAVHRVATRGGK